MCHSKKPEGPMSQKTPNWLNYGSVPPKKFKRFSITKPIVKNSKITHIFFSNPTKNYASEMFVAMLLILTGSVQAGSRSMDVRVRLCTFISCSLICGTTWGILSYVAICLLICSRTEKQSTLTTKWKEIIRNKVRIYTTGGKMLDIKLIYCRKL